MTDFSPGSLVRCRERDWVVLPSVDPDNLLLLRPLGGGESEITGIYRPLAKALGQDVIASANFPDPDPSLAGDHTSGRLLRDAARLLFRSGAGPFRSLGRITVRPRPFQLVPLIMALRQETVRLLIADDVGIGKTIEAGLIARELMDRGEVRRLCVLCPPHLCDQWQRELEQKFNIDAVIVRSSTVAQLERGLLGDQSIFNAFDAMVVSIDLAKAERWRHSFLQGCPDMVIVDEAHTAARSGSTGVAQQRHALLRDVAKDKNRHLLLLTATPHSGLEDAFRSLLELLDSKFADLNLEHLSENDRRWMARHFVQRRRADVQKWMGADTPFPQRQTDEALYRLYDSPEYRKLFEEVYAFARELVRDNSVGQQTWKQRVRYWAALALLRCVMSSPAAAQATFEARLKKEPQPSGEGAAEISYVQFVFDQGGQDTTGGSGDVETAVDFEPAPPINEGGATLERGERAKLESFLKRAGQLRGDADPKMLKLVDMVAKLVQDDFHPIVYCRYIATAEYVAEELRKRLGKRWGDLQVVAVTGLSAEDEREARVRELAGSVRRVLVATDCLSEGINLQNEFNAVIHYDLPWNPNRLEQREGRVDRYGQPSPIVRVSLLHGADNPIDTAVLEVLLRKARSIHKTLGVTVPLPLDGERVVDTLVRRVFLEGVQLRLGEDPAAELAAVDKQWDAAVEREKASRTRFAQHAIKPEEVAQELAESDVALGSPADVREFLQRACAALEVSLQPVKNMGAGEQQVWRLGMAGLPGLIQDRVRPVFSVRGKVQTEPLIGFDGPLPENVFLVGRTHPLIEALAEHLLDGALLGGEAPLPATRCGVTRSEAVKKRTTLLLLRLRLLIEQPKSAAPLLAEELVVKAFAGHGESMDWLDDSEALRLLDEARADAPVAPGERTEVLQTVIEEWLPDLGQDRDNIARERAAELLKSHDRVRAVTGGGKVDVRPSLPIDVLGVFVLLPVPRGIRREG